MLQLVLSPVNLFLNDNYQVVSQCLCGCMVEVVLVVKLNYFFGRNFPVVGRFY